ncbi:hypothetical protein EJ576_06055 [Pseudomonas sp. C 49-2]|uniref:hypothetical protein n=1 Tax=Pseudomonas TaxID=286 RepID=UPI000F829A49|nr:hypothetical protein [Pseudomonas sp. C 49-2]RTY02865.1 hypothetical protein EJ576_06055 [Pseudomonas sp. C 49-2]
MKNELSWYSLERDYLPELMLGENKLNIFGNSSFSTFQLDRIKVAVGFVLDGKGIRRDNPSVIVLDDNSSADIMSWLRVYAPETSPISQIVRVVSYEDWEVCRRAERARTSANITYHWACLTLGEVLAQSENETEIRNVPLSRAQASYTNTVAKAHTLHTNDRINRITIDRLKSLERESRFVKRSVSVEALQPMWTLLEDFVPKRATGAESIPYLVDHIEKTHYTSTRSLIGPRLRNFPGLQSDSIEERVITFHKIANEILDSPDHRSLSVINAATLSAAAFLVGRGTSHIFLLRKFTKEFPTSLAWFGLFAAYGGINCWDPEWARAVRSIERSFQSKFEWSDPSQVDLCWTEYSWLTKTYDSNDVFSDIPKMYPHVLSVEVIPGAACQFRLLSTTTSSESDNKKQAIENLKDKELQLTISELLNLAVKAKNLMSYKLPELSAGMESFELDGSSRGRDPRSKRGSRYPSGK